MEDQTGCDTGEVESRSGHSGGSSLQPDIARGEFRAEPTQPEAAGAQCSREELETSRIDFWQTQGSSPDAPFARRQIPVSRGTVRTDMTIEEFKHFCKDLKWLSLFHGFRRPKNGLEAFAGKYGVEVECWDLEIDS